MLLQGEQIGLRVLLGQAASVALPPSTSPWHPLGCQIQGCAHMATHMLATPCGPPYRMLPVLWWQLTEGKASSAIDLALQQGARAQVPPPRSQISLAVLSPPPTKPRVSRPSRIRLSLINRPMVEDGKQVVPGEWPSSVQQKDIILAASASPSACTIFCRCSCFAFSTKNWARWASCWAVAEVN